MGLQCDPTDGPIVYNNCVYNPANLFRQTNWYRNKIRDIPEIIFVVGAGNIGQDAADTTVPARLSLELDNVITVGAINPTTNNRWSALNRDVSSNYGPAITVATSGFDVHSVSTSLPGIGYQLQQGTSIAAPLVTGVVALMRSIDPDIPAYEVKDILQVTATLTPVCRTNSRDDTIDQCPAEDVEQWLVMNADAAIRELLRRRGISVSESTAARPTPPAPGSPDSDRETLVALYNATNGDQWRNITNWLSEAPLHQWHGVETDTTGRVISLSLSGNWLDGGIPSELGSLSNLRRLDLADNLLSGKLPPELSNLTDLKTLSLQSNQLSGAIPAELGNLARLESLSLHSNQLSGGITAKLGDLINLESIHLSSNQLSGEIPAEFGSLANLEAITLAANQLTGEIPGELNKLKLRSVWLTGNQFTGCTPPRFKAALSSDVHKLELPYCEDVATITSGPAEADRDALVAISRDAGSSLVGVFTNSSGRVIALHVSLARGQLGRRGTGGTISEQLRRLTSLESLSVALSERPSSIVIPPSLGKLTNLKELSISSRDGLSRIPAELGNLANLESLYLFDSGDGFISDGSIPAELGNLLSLSPNPPKEGVRLAS